jgi:hypothetical protein
MLQDRRFRSELLSEWSGPTREVILKAEAIANKVTDRAAAKAFPLDDDRERVDEITFLATGFSSCSIAVQNSGVLIKSSLHKTAMSSLRKQTRDRVSKPFLFHGSESRQPGVRCASATAS